uniref:Uncharacterized protein n=1 Tax=Anguilla anguilla TaxID=7936 RepID=A0A0E9V9X2_ANGAN
MITLAASPHLHCCKSLWIRASAKCL